MTTNKKLGVIELVEGLEITDDAQEYLFDDLPALSKEWEIDVFGGGHFIYCPAETSVPNWFHRKMHELMLGVKWVRKDKTETATQPPTKEKDNG